MTDLIGRTIGNYQIESLLGTGGMGQVFRAEHRFLNRSAAVKVMHVHLAADESFQSRFLHEAKSSSDLNHPNIVQIYDFGEEAGRYYLVMELMPNGSLRTALRDQQRSASSWSLATGVELLRQAAEALGYAHSRGMIHRDVKPDNLLLGFPSDDVSASIVRDEPVVKICDFGLARLMEGQHLTASGVMMGTPAYMSPEQCQGHPIDGRSDIYSLGVVLYEVLTGSPPFKTSQPSEAIYKHVYVEPLPPRSIRPELTPEMEEIVLRCLAKRPDDRFASAAELAAALSATPTNWGVRPLFASAQPAGEQNGTTVVHDRGLPTGTPATVGAVGPAPAAPSLPTLLSDRHVPLLYLTDASGTTRAVFDLTEAGATIGRSDDNVISIEDAGVSRHHARIDWDGRRATATDLHSTNGVSIGDVTLIPGQPSVWDGLEPLRIGKHWLRLALPNPAAVEPYRVASLDTSPASVQPAAVTVAPHAIAQLSLTLDRPTLEIQPGERAIVQATVSNDSDAPDSVELVVDGVPREWVTPSANTIELQPRGAA
ncbi:MAG: protein kinase domain-containing protein, partial [Vicinamibacterales bacterium]